MIIGDYMEHWIERIADDLNSMDVKKHTIASGTFLVQYILEIPVIFLFQMLWEKHLEN